MQEAIGFRNGLLGFSRGLNHEGYDHLVVELDEGRDDEHFALKCRRTLERSHLDLIMCAGYTWKIMDEPGWKKVIKGKNPWSVNDLDRENG